jgi:hypothetical protein
VDVDTAVGAGTGGDATITAPDVDELAIDEPFV